MFVRTKKIKGKDYAYLVENFWSEKGSRQKVKQYIGSVRKLEKTGEVEALLDESKDYKSLARDSAKHELLKHGFIEEEGFLKKEGIVVDLFEGKVRDNIKNVALSLNEGFLCESTINQLLNFIPQGSNTEIGMKLANNLLEAGIKLSQEEFIKLCNKVMKEENVEEVKEDKKEEFYY